MTKQASKNWQLNRQINLSMIVQLVFLACLIVASWMNLQSQLNLLQRDVKYLCQSQKNLQNKLESLSAKSVAYDYRLKILERFVLDTDCLKGQNPDFKNQRNFNSKKEQHNEKSYKKVEESSP